MLTKREGIKHRGLAHHCLQCQHCNKAHALSNHNADIGDLAIIKVASAKKHNKLSGFCCLCPHPVKVILTWPPDAFHFYNPKPTLPRERKVLQSCQHDSKNGWTYQLEANPHIHNTCAPMWCLATDAFRTFSLFLAVNLMICDPHCVQHYFMRIITMIVATSKWEWNSILDDLEYVIV